MKAKFKLLTKDARLPTRKHEGDVGFDIYSIENTVIPPGHWKIVHTGIQLADMPGNIFVQVWPKSGLDAKEGITVGAGIIDSGYRGEVLVLLRNLSGFNFHLAAGDPIAQLIFLPRLDVEVARGEEIVDTERSADGGIVRTIKEKRSET